MKGVQRLDVLINLSTGICSLPGPAFAFFMVMVINEARMCCLPSCRRGGCVWAATRVHSIQGTAHESLKSLAGSLCSISSSCLEGSGAGPCMA